MINEVENFPNLPDCAQVRIPTVRALLGIGTSSVWRLVRSGVLKTRKYTPRTTTFNVGELRKFLAERQSF